MQTLRLMVLLASALTLFGCRSERGSGARQNDRTQSNQEHVGAAGHNRFVTAVNQILTPAGVTVELPGLRPQALALSPNGKILVTSGKTSEIVVVDPATGKFCSGSACLRKRIRTPRRARFLEIF